MSARPAPLVALLRGKPPQRRHGERPRPSPEQLLTAEQLAQRWQVPKSHVYRLTREGTIPAVKLGRYYRYSPAAIAEWEGGATGGGGTA